MSGDIKMIIADEAVSITTGARRKGYGAPEQNFARIAALWNAHLTNIGVIEGDQRRVHPEDVATMMILMKIARLAETVDHRDSVVDLTGYALCYAECVLPSPALEEYETFSPSTQPLQAREDQIERLLRETRSQSFPS